MLKDKPSSAIVAVADIDQARHFYADTLGLEVANLDMEGVLAFSTGATTLIVYQSEQAGTNRANAVVWGVDDEIDAITADLEAKGVAFEHYPDMEGVTLRGNMHIAGDMKLVWFKDPDGNILHLNNM